jgi:hypothetical protein
LCINQNRCGEAKDVYLAYGVILRQPETENRDLDVAAHRVAQHIGQVQSSLLRMSGSFQRALNKIESQRVHLGASGLSTSDVIGWLRGLPSAALSQFADGSVSCIPESRLVLGDIALDIAEFELIDRERPERVNVPLPPAEDAPTAENIFDDAEDLTSALWPRDYVALLRDRLAQETAHTRFATLLKVAGHARAEMAGQVLEDLLRAGWIEIEERRAGGTWKPIWLRFLDPDRLRLIVVLPDRGGALDRLKELKKRALCAADLRIDLGVGEQIGEQCAEFYACGGRTGDRRACRVLG